MATPARKLVHWDSLSPGFSDLGSASSDASFISTSSLQYINAQLVAHGFAAAPGLSLEGMSNADMEKTVKCLLELLGQRMKDMTRTEELTTDLRTLSYDHERLKSMHTVAVEKAANFEREMNVQKSRLQATTKNLQASEQAHKLTTGELQRTRGALQTVRATHLSELKKKEKEVEKMADKWAKLADMQTKLSTAPSGFKAANSKIITGAEVVGKGMGLLEAAAQEAEKARTQITTECIQLKRVVLNAVNELQQVLHSLMGQDEEKPTPFTLTTLFPFCAPEHASDHLASVLLGLRDSIRDITGTPTPQSPSLSNDERDRMKSIIDSLRTELDAAKSSHSVQNTEAQEVLDKFASDTRLAIGHDKGDMSVELMTIPQHDELQERLDYMRKQLEEERKRFTEATVLLGHERAAIEAEKQKLNDEKRSWQVEMMLSELPPTPAVGQPEPSVEPVPAPRSPRKVPHSPRKSPIKVAPRKATRIKRKSSLLTSPRKSRVEPAYETEVIAHTIPISVPTDRVPPPPSLSTTLLPTSFVLPPPSPQAAFPSSPPLPSFVPTSVISLGQPQFQTPSEEGLGATQSTTPTSPIPGAPTTPQPVAAFRRPYPIAKPFAPRMIHAYSPVRPSPLSRILQLGNSPDANPLFDDASGSTLDPLAEEDEDDHPFQDRASPPLTLAQELGVPDSPPERSPSPLLEKRSSNAKAKSVGAASTTEKGRVMPQPKRFTAQEKGKAVVKVKEKENTAVKRKPPAAAPTIAKVVPAKPVSLAASRARAMGKIPAGKRVQVGEVSKIRRVV